MASTKTPARRERPAAVDRPFEALRRDIDDLFSDFFSGPLMQRFDVPLAEGGVIAPRVDVSETSKKFDVVAELPGVDQKDIDLAIADGILTIKAEKKSEKEEKGKTWHRVERSYGNYQRSLSLPASADPDKVKASFDKGVLTISVPKKAEAKPPTRKIDIRSS